MGNSDDALIRRDAKSNDTARKGGPRSLRVVCAMCLAEATKMGAILRMRRQPRGIGTISPAALALQQSRAIGRGHETCAGPGSCPGLCRPVSRPPNRRRVGAIMMKQASVVVLTLGIVGHVAASGRDQLARFDGGIGVVPVSNVAVNATTGAVTVTRNIVRGVNPPGQIWVIADLKADVDTNGRIKVRGRGLLLGGGSSIGQNANQSVLATLICEAAAPFTLHNTDAAGVPLEPNGDFEIDDTLDPSVSSDCASPVLLIRNTGGVWFAAGIPKPGHDDD